MLSSSSRFGGNLQRLARQFQGVRQSFAILRSVEPAAGSRGVRQGDDRNALVLEAAADAGGQVGAPEQGAQRQSADRHDQARAQQPELLLPPEAAELPL